MGMRAFYRTNREAVLFCAKFLGVLAAFHLLVTEALLGSWLNLWDLFASLAAKAAGGVLALFGLPVQVSGDLIIHPQTSVRVSKGCDGLTASIIYVAAVIAFRAELRAKVLGALGGFLAIQVFNVLRVMALFLTLLYFPAYFEDMHVYIMQALVIAFGAVVWFFWAQRYAKIPAR